MLHALNAHNVLLVNYFLFLIQIQWQKFICLAVFTELGQITSKSKIKLMHSD